MLRIGVVIDPRYLDHEAGAVHPERPARRGRLTKGKLPGDGEGEVCRDPEQTFDPTEPLAHVIMHIPEPRRHLLGYIGTTAASAGTWPTCAGR